MRVSRTIVWPGVRAEIEALRLHWGTIGFPIIRVVHLKYRGALLLNFQLYADQIWHCHQG